MAKGCEGDTVKKMPPKRIKDDDTRNLTGDELRSLRESVADDFTQGDMAELMGIARESYNRLEKYGPKRIPLDRAISARCLIAQKKRKQK